MTPRLRMLSVGLALSLSYAIYDYIDRNSDKKPVVTKSKEIQTKFLSTQYTIKLVKVNSQII